MRSSKKTCRDCRSDFVRQEQTDKQWDMVSRCPSCEREHLKVRLTSVIEIDPEKGCWIWLRSTKNGYGQITIHDVSTYAHHVSYELFVGPIPPGRTLCHSCDVPRCISPEHLLLGTQLINVRDMWAKGRAIKPPVHRGVANANAILTDQQVAEVRRFIAEGAKQRDVAKQFGVSQSTVWRFKHGITRQEEVR